MPSVVFVKWDPSRAQFVANAFQHVDVVRTFMQHDPDIGGQVAKVVVDDADLELAFGPNGVYPRLAAMLTQTDVEIVLPHEVSDL
jgi:transcription antitermination factor NusA-like protein